MKLKITVDNRTYEVDVEVSDAETAGAPAPLQPMEAYSVPVTAPAQISPPPASGENVCKSPVSGIVVRVAAQVGQAIQRGDVLIVLEAMKMETNITAPIDGVVKTVLAQPGESVRAGQVVVDFE